MTKINRITHYDENGDLPNFDVAPFDGKIYLLRLPCGNWASGELIENYETGNHPAEQGFTFYQWAVLTDEHFYDYESITHWTELPDWDAYYNSPDNQEVNELMEYFERKETRLDEDWFFNHNDGD